jgi:muramidase (phage lysozyme)
MNNFDAFLYAIGISEGTINSPITKDRGYDVLVSGINGPARFDSYASHPNILVTVNHNGLKSTAAGRYQILYHNFLYYKNLLGLDDFSPEAQDKIALQMIKETGADGDIESGDIQSAVVKVAHLWASFPGEGYPMQHQNTMDSILASFNQGLEAV